MKVFAMVMILAITSISSVSSALCSRKYGNVAAATLMPNNSTAYFPPQYHNNSPADSAVTASNENVSRQR